ncbi:MAG: cytochrome c3 family protein [Desulfobacteraceae bacterium]
MKKERYLFRWAGILTISIIALSGTGIYGLSKVLKVSSQPRADVIKIDNMIAFGKLEKAPVEFLHEAHTEALAKKNKDCAACHLTQNKRMFPKFKRIADTDRIEVMDIYHKGCISCHGEMKVAKEKAGPVECEGCHREKIQHLTSRQPIGFDKSLHFRHSEAQENKCELCHHEYDEKAKKLFYVKGKEGTCRYCHKEKTKDNLMSMGLSSHISCIDCHQKNISKSLTTGPVTCSGCHDPAVQQKIKKITPIPRMDRKQPDIVMLKNAPKGIGTDTENTNKMAFVPFDHKAHENYNDTCRVCHHESLKQCNECHALAGMKEGNMVNLEKAMHQVDSTRSCQGCHEAKQNDKNCAGCHVFMGKERVKEDTSCLKCHSAPGVEKKKASNPDDEKTLVKTMLQSRNLVPGTYPENNIPEKVVIKKLSKEYEAVDFPHRKVVNTLVKNIKDNKLAGYFHSQKGSICKGCHHNSPVSTNPPHCGNCHGKPFDAKNPSKPGIIGAYHQQCMGCHKEMGIEKPAGCTECHKKKKN